MIWQLVKRDPAWRNALFCMAGAVVYPALPSAFIGMFGFTIGMFWLQCLPQRRATNFQAGLPIRACDLFLARILAFFALVWLPVAAGVTLLLLLRKPVEDAATGVEIGAGFSVLVLVAQSSRVREIAGSRWTPAVSWAIVCGAAWPISRFVPPAIVLVVCALLCAVLFWNIWRQLPPSFEVLLAKPVPQVSSQGKTAARAFVYWPILRSLFQWRTFGFLPMIAMLTLNGQWLSASVFCVCPVLASMPLMPWVLGLPIRRSTLLAVILLPWVMAPLLGLLLGNGFGFGDKSPIRLEWSASNRISDVRPPLEFWRTGKAPVIESPWGETWRPETVRVLGLAVYNPYSFGPGSSPRFFEWQFRRATEAVYGEAIDYAYFKSHRPGVRPLMRQARLAILNLAACTCWVMLLVNLLFTSFHWRVRRLWQHGQVMLLGLLVAQMMILLLIDVVPESHSAGRIRASMVNALLLRVSSVLPASLPAVALAAAIPVALLSWSAARIFRGVEIPPAAAARL